MAKKSKASNRKTFGKKGPSRGANKRLVLGGTAFIVVIAIVVGIKLSQKQSLPPRLEGAIDGHYTKGKASAAVVIKEFSDYT